MATASTTSGKGGKPPKTDKAVKKAEKKAQKKMAEAATGRNGQAKPEDSGKESKSRIKYESSMPRDEAVAYFEAIVAGLRKGAIKFKRGEEEISMSPGEHVDVEVKASRKRDKETVSFEITWRADSDADLTISAS